jgi:hypothetical protein
MSAIKRPAADSGFTENPPKRARPMPLSQRRPADLRPVQPSSNHEVIYISSTSPDGADVPLTTPMEPSGGIKPNDSLQDEHVNSIEFAPIGRSARTGIEHYLFIAKTKAKNYATVSVDFNPYKHAAPPGAPPGDPLPETAPQMLDLGPPDPRYNYKLQPEHWENYALPIYKAKTYNPLLALAITRLAEKNLPFINWTSELAHLPNVGPQTLPPEFPPPEAGEPMPYLDAATTWTVLPGDQVITIVFLPEYYIDGRHALGFYTRKMPSRLLCSIICTPCTTAELRAAGLLDLAPVASGVPISAIQDGAVGREDMHMKWGWFGVGVNGGEWLYPTLESDIIEWEDVEDVVGFEWVVRVRVTVRTTAEESDEARKRDGGMWGESRYE